MTSFWAMRFEGKGAKGSQGKDSFFLKKTHGMEELFFRPWILWCGDVLAGAMQ